MNRINIDNRIAQSIVRSAVILLFLITAACINKKESDRSGTSVKFDQYYVQGEQLYIKNCSNCHQKEGTGLGLLYPPLKNSDYLMNHRNEVICLIKNGKSGELIVNGKSFNMVMPAMPSLTDLEIAEITTYIYNEWGNDQGLIDVNEVSAILAKCDSLNVD